MTAHALSFKPNPTERLCAVIDRAFYVVPAWQLLIFYKAFFLLTPNDIAVGAVVTVDRPSMSYHSADPSSLWKSLIKCSEATESSSISCVSLHSAGCPASV